MQKSDRLAAATGVLIAATGLVVAILCPFAGAIGGAIFGANLGAGLGILGSIGCGIAGCGVGFGIGRGMSHGVFFGGTMMGAIAARGIKLGAFCIRKTKALFKFGFDDVTKTGRPRRHITAEDKKTVFKKIAGLFSKSAAKKSMPKATFARATPQPQGL